MLLLASVHAVMQITVGAAYFHETDSFSQANRSRVALFDTCEQRLPGLEKYGECLACDRAGIPSSLPIRSKIDVKSIAVEGHDTDQVFAFEYPQYGPPVQ